MEYLACELRTDEIGFQVAKECRSRVMDRVAESSKESSDPDAAKVEDRKIVP